MVSTRPAPVPVADRPRMPRGYGVPRTTQGLLPWSHVEQRLTDAKNYWVSTSGPGGRPHAMPIWGGYVDGTLYVEGSPMTRRGRDLAQNPQVAVHLESGDDVVALEGIAEHLTSGPDPEVGERLAAAMTAKYTGYSPSPHDWDSGGLYAIRPRVAFAWRQFPKDCTRFRFDVD
jgi:Pyridoxamine 5'-phosphate oxidase